MTTTTSTTAADAVTCEGVSVRFGSFVAVDDVSLRLPAGRIHVIVGQNGAGKTTLARVLAGLQTRDGGRVHLNGIELVDADRAVARAAGVEMVHQHSALVPELTVAETLELNRPAHRWRPFRRGDIERRWTGELTERGLDIDVARRVGDLSVELRQSVEIAATDPGDGGVLILDEPTAALPPQRVDALFERLREINERGTTVILVLHKLSEIRRIADTVTVLRTGRMVLAAAPITSIDDTELAELIIGSAFVDAPAASTPTVTDGAGLTLRTLRATPAVGDRDLDGVDLDIPAGKLTGIAGVEGNGQRTLVETLVGLSTIRSGTIHRGADEWTTLDVAARRRLGLRAVPFDRFAEGSAEDLSLAMNLTAWEAPRHRRWRRLPFLDTGAIRARARERLEATGVAYQELAQPAGSLSGGNLQRLILARELDGAEVMVAAQPTRGLDIDGTSVVWRALTELAAAEVPVLVVSSDLDELLDHCHRIAVMRSGRIVAEHERPFDRDEIGRDMVGAA